MTLPGQDRCESYRVVMMGTRGRMFECASGRVPFVLCPTAARCAHIGKERLDVACPI